MSSALDQILHFQYRIHSLNLSRMSRDNYDSWYCWPSENPLVFGSAASIERKQVTKIKCHTTGRPSLINWKLNPQQRAVDPEHPEHVLADTKVSSYECIL
jgi:hypothetical protein